MFRGEADGGMTMTKKPALWRVAAMHSQKQTFVGPLRIWGIVLNVPYVTCRLQSLSNSNSTIVAEGAQNNPFTIKDLKLVPWETAN